MIKITANSKEYEIKEGLLLSQFVEILKVNFKICVVELNGKALKIGEDAQLKNSDKLEIMQIVAGG